MSFSFSTNRTCSHLKWLWTQNVSFLSVCCSQKPQNHNFHSDCIIPLPDSHRWKIPWISSLPTVSLSLGEAMKPPWQGMRKSHLRALEAEPTQGGKLQNWRIGFGNSTPQVPQSCAGVPEKQSWEIKEKMLRCFWSWNEEFLVLSSTADTSFLGSWGCWMSQSKHSWPQPEQEEKEEEPREGEDLSFPHFSLHWLPPPLPFPAATVPQHQELIQCHNSKCYLFISTTSVLPFF